MAGEGFKTYKHLLVNACDKFAQPGFQVSSTKNSIVSIDIMYI